MCLSVSRKKLRGYPFNFCIYYIRLRQQKEKTVSEKQEDKYNGWECGGIFSRQVGKKLGMRSVY